ncbi:MAG TPA: glycosyl transferase family 2, partial [Tenuifilaceae bacterium]|nr:glycosyl transferase family 2 [Tenuifilaceae bacterium]
IELSINIYKQGFKIGLISDAYVYHKRRTSIKQFYRQVYNFGYARVTLSRRNKGTLKLVHLLPLAFTLGSVGLVICAIFISWMFLLPLMLFMLLVNLDAIIRKRSLLIAKLAMFISLIQLYGYGLGFMKGVWDVMRGKSIGQ